MGVHENISFDRYPKQSKWLYKAVEVCFNYDTSKTIMGQIIRDDLEEPGELIILLDDGRVVRATECQYHIIRKRG